MGATGHYIKTKNKDGSGEKAKSVNVIPEDGTISISKTETEDETTFAVRTTFDGLEQLSAGSNTGSGYYNIIDVELKTNTRYTVLLLLTGGSYTPVYKDFAIYNIRLGYGTGGENSNYALIQEISRLMGPRHIFIAISLFFLGYYLGRNKQKQIGILGKMSHPVRRSNEIDGKERNDVLDMVEVRIARNIIETAKRDSVLF